MVLNEKMYDSLKKGTMWKEINNFFQKFFGEFDFGHFFCPNLKSGMTFLKKPLLYSIIEI